MGVQMTSQDDFLNLMDDAPVKSSEKEGDIGVSSGGGLITSFPSPNQNVIERTIHTITQFRIYPNGQVFIVKSQSWMDKAGTIVKKKEKPKPIKVQKSILQEKEEY